MKHAKTSFKKSEYPNCLIHKTNSWLLGLNNSFWKSQELGSIMLPERWRIYFKNLMTFLKNAKAFSSKCQGVFLQTLRRFFLMDWFFWILKIRRENQGFLLIISRLDASDFLKDDFATWKIVGNASLYYSQSLSSNWKISSKLFSKTIFNEQHFYDYEYKSEEFSFFVL